MTKAVSIPTDNREQDLIYKTVGELAVELSFFPPIRDIYPKAPVIFIISGGGWHFESRANMLGFAQIAVQNLRERGWAAVNIDYRVTTQSPDITIQSEVSDVMDAARYITNHAEALKIDPTKIVAYGHSAGAHLAMMLAFAPHELFQEDSILQNDFEIMGCIPFSGIAMLYPDGQCENPMLFDSNYLYKDKIYDREMAYRCSPYEYISQNAVPALFIHGSKDPLVHPDNSILSYTKGIECGANFELILGQNGGHCLESLVEGEHSYPSFDTAQWIISAWLQKTFGI